jgi:hypothetical protein
MKFRKLAIAAFAAPVLETVSPEAPRGYGSEAEQKAAAKGATEFLGNMATDQLAQLIENEIEEDGSVIDPDFRKAVVAEIASRNPRNSAAVAATETTAQEVVAEAPAAKPLSKKAAAKAAKQAAATASEPATLADIADLPSFAVPGETATTAPKAAKAPAAPKAPKVPSEKSANQKVVFALLARDEGATITDIVAAIGAKGSAISWLRSAAKNGYATRIEKMDGKNRYYATKRPA